jgi:hypothetical protein
MTFDDNFDHYTRSLLLLYEVSFDIRFEDDDLQGKIDAFY